MTDSAGNTMKAFRERSGAKPSEFIIALRKYEISELGWPGLSRRLLTSPLLAATSSVTAH